MDAMGNSHVAVLAAVTPDGVLLHTLIGLSFGLLLFLVASGFTLTFGLARFVNLSHGATFLIAAHVAAQVDRRIEVFALAVLAAAVTGVLVALAVFGLARLRWQAITADPTRQVLFTFGCLLVIADDLMSFGAHHNRMSDFVPPVKIAITSEDGPGARDR